MKAWRKHNMEQGEIIAAAKAELEWCHKIGVPTNSPVVAEYHKQISQARGFKLKTKTERRNQYSSEQAQPHGLIFRLMYGPQWKEVVETIGEMLQSLQANRFKDPYEGKYLQMIGGEWTKPNLSK